MDNFLNTDLENKAARAKLNCVSLVYRAGKKSHVKTWLGGLCLLLLVTLFLPWTQNIRATGKVTTLRQEQRPQEVNTIIAGSIIKWYVKEGDFIKKGDTILKLGEVKIDYLDPNLLKRTEEQITSKKITVESYKGKAGTAIDQVAALNEGRKLKLQSLENKIEQQRLKVNSDEADVQAAQNELAAYTRQIQAAKQMLDSGAISLSDFERKKINHQNAIAKSNNAANKLLQSKQELVNLQLEQQATNQDYADKIAKAEGDRFSAMSNAASTEAEITKLQNLYASYDVRNKLYYILAPQDGQITKAKKAGLGEFVKEGEMIVEIVPNDIQHAVELFVKPMDLPLVNKGQKVRFVFDGFPAIVFSGWPGNSYGTFGGIVAAVEKSLSENGKFRVLVKEDPTERKWPEQLSIGTGAEGIMLLKDVKIYYELWRNINGFPPRYYKPEETKDSNY
jgi:multidrug efflux pump subunit AcrA (membrane-fusion protein)